VVRLTIPMRGGALRLHSQTLKVLFILFALATGVSRAQADAALLMEEPYGQFGFFNPTGHSAFTSTTCAQSLQLSCGPVAPASTA
jgi:hypothetical protein